MFQSSALRAIVSIVVGVMLVIYRKTTLEWMVIIAGGLFFLSGCLSCLFYFLGRRKMNRDRGDVNKKGHIVKVSSTPLPIAGVGSILLGLILIFMTGFFIRGVAYVLAGILILGAINQFVTLGGLRQYARVPFFYWLLPAVTLAVGILIVLKPIGALASPLLIVGWCLVFYGVVEGLNSLKIYQLQRRLRMDEASALISKSQDTEDVDAADSDSKD